MSTYLLKLSQNVFHITLATAFLLGISLAFLFSKTLLLLFTNTNKDLVNIYNLDENTNFFQLKNSVDLPPPDRTQISALATDNLFRGTPVITTQATLAASFNIQGLTLVGVLAGSPRIARATILEEGQKVEVYSIGDRIKGGKLIKINEKSVLLEGDDKTRATLILGEKAGAPIQAQNTPIKTPTTGARVENITLNRDRFKQLIKNQAELFRLKFAPNIEGTKITGWKLLKVPEDHFLYSMGARTGDTIKRYNGQDLESQDRMISMWLSLQSANKVSVDLDRGGQMYTYNIGIQ